MRKQSIHCSSIFSETTQYSAVAVHHERLSAWRRVALYSPDLSSTLCCSDLTPRLATLNKVGRCSLFSRATATSEETQTFSFFPFIPPPRLAVVQQIQSMNLSLYSRKTLLTTDMLPIGCRRPVRVSRPVPCWKYNNVHQTMLSTCRTLQRRYLNFINTHPGLLSWYNSKQAIFHEIVSTTKLTKYKVKFFQIPFKVSKESNHSLILLTREYSHFVWLNRYHSNNSRIYFSCSLCTYGHKSKQETFLFIRSHNRYVLPQFDPSSISSNAQFGCPMGLATSYFCIVVQIETSLRPSPRVYLITFLRLFFFYFAIRKSPTQLLSACNI